MYKKEFKGDVCPRCGTMLIVTTKCSEDKDDDFEQTFNDGDKVNCDNKHCNFKTEVVCEDDEAWLRYYDEN